MNLSNKENIVKRLCSRFWVDIVIVDSYGHHNNIIINNDGINPKLEKNRVSPSTRVEKGLTTPVFFFNLGLMQLLLGTP